MSDDIRPELAALFNNLVDSMRSLDLSLLQSLHKEISDGKFCRKNQQRMKKYFHDALSMLGTVDALTMIGNLASSSEIMRDSLPLLVAPFSFTHSPSKEMVAAATRLLDLPSMSPALLLPISSIGASHCRSNPADSCEHGANSEIEALLTKYIEMVGDCSEAESKYVVRAVRSLVLADVFMDPSEDSEMRITAYLGMMRCIDANSFYTTDPAHINKILHVVNNTLHAGDSLQLGAFVWSYLNTIWEKSELHSEATWLHSILSSEKLRQKLLNTHKGFSGLNVLRYSGHYEHSVFSEGANIGASSSANVIFSPKSFVPRSASVNLTLNVLGRSVNLVELGLHSENLEWSLERQFSEFSTTKRPYKMKNQQLYLRLHGNELFYGKPGELLLLPDWLTVFKTLQLASGRLTYPTVLGLPLHMKMRATGATNTNDQSKWKGEERKLAIKFSGVLEIESEMTVEAPGMKTGLRMVNTAHSSTGVDFFYRRGVLSVKFPQKKLEYLNLNTTLYTVQGQTVQPYSDMQQADANYDQQ
ncbi:hypothetical protein Ahia01_000906000, partial [Argonauta hians]